MSKSDPIVRVTCDSCGKTIEFPSNCSFEERLCDAEWREDKKVHIPGHYYVYRHTCSECIIAAES